MRKILPFKEFEAFSKLEANLNSIRPILEFEDPLDEIIANEISDEIRNRVSELNEALSSNYLRSILDGMPSQGRSKYDAEFAKALYSSYKIALNDVQDSDFILHGDPSVAFSSASKAKPNSLFFMMCDRKAIIDRLNGNQGKIPNPFVVSIIKEGKGLMTTKATDPKVTITKRVGSTYSQRSTDRYGWLSDLGELMIFPRKFFKEEPESISVSRDAVLSIATFALELDLDAFIARQGTVADIRKQRYEQKKGVLVWTPGDKKELEAIRIANLDRRKAMIGAKVTLGDLYSIYDDTQKLITSSISKFFHAGNIPPDPAAIPELLGISTKSWSKMPDFVDNKMRSFGNIFSNSISALRDAVRFCYDYYEKADRIDKLTNCLEAGKIPDENFMPSSVDMKEVDAKKIKYRIELFSSNMAESLKELTTYKSYMMRYYNEANQILLSK